MNGLRSDVLESLDFSPADPILLVLLATGFENAVSDPSTTGTLAAVDGGDCGALCDDLVCAEGFRDFGDLFLDLFGAGRVGREKFVGRLLG